MVMKVLIVLGTRPEAIKLWPVITELKRREIETIVVSTNQQKDLLPPILKELGIKVDLNAAGGCDQVGMRHADLCDVFGVYVSQLGNDIELKAPNWVLVQGDTTTALAGALAAFYAGVKVGHVEAGLRSHDLSSPFPEEGNRRMISQIASMHFAPTTSAYRTLLADTNVPDCILTGNTIVDALHAIRNRHEHIHANPCDLLVTFHRRESWDQVERLAEQVVIASTQLDLRVRWILHGNPELAERITTALQQTKVHTVRPMGYGEFIRHLCATRIVITDSGGVIEEAVSLGKPLVIVRDVTERPEALRWGARLVKLDKLDELAGALQHILEQDWASVPVFGDGTAAKQIVDALVSA